MQPTAIPTYRLPTTTGLTLPMLTSRLEPADSLTWDQTPDRHTFYALFWIVEGAGWHHIDFDAYEIRPNSLFLMRPGQTHFFNVQQAISGYNFFFNEDWLHLDNVSRQTAKLFYMVEQRPVLYPNPEQSSLLTQAFEQSLYEFSSVRLGKAEALQCLFQLLLIHVQRAHHQAHMLNHTEAESHLSTEFYHLVGQQFNTTHRLADYARALGVSTGYLNRKVKAATGMAAGHLIRQRLLIEAKRLLVHTDQSATEIAHTIGFEDSAYFGRFFKRATGVTPLSFRRTWYKKYQNRS